MFEIQNRRNLIFLWRFRRFWLFIDRIYITLFFPQGLREDSHPSSRVSAAVISSWSRRRPFRFHLPSGTQGGKGERSNHSIKREQKELAHSAERENGRMKSNLCVGPAPPHSPWARDTPFPLGERHRAHPHTTGRAGLLCLLFNRISGGQSFHRRCPGESLALGLAVSWCPRQPQDVPAGGGNMLPMPWSVFPVSMVDKLRMPRRCQPFKQWFGEEKRSAMTALPYLAEDLSLWMGCFHQFICHISIICPGSVPRQWSRGQSGSLQTPHRRFCHGLWCGGNTHRRLYLSTVLDARFLFLDDPPTLWRSTAISWKV